MARAGMSDEEMTAFLKEMFCVDSAFTAADLFNAAELAAAILADGVHCGRRSGTGSCVSIRQTTTLVVRGLGRAFLCLSVCLKRPPAAADYEYLSMYGAANLWSSACLPVDLPALHAVPALACRTYLPTPPA